MESQASGPESPVEPPPREPSFREKALASFQATLARRRPYATFALLAAIAAMFALELGVGALESNPVMARTGALLPDNLARGEPWRLLSCAFLHGSWLHLALNGIVLFSIGVLLERLLGTRRFLVLYGLSALGGSLVSSFFLEGISVGASGALWGLLAAEFGLATRSGILPAEVRASVLKSAGQNLGLNVVNSLRPGVDWAAHLGGGLVGLALVLLGTLTLGLPRWGAAERGMVLEEDRPPRFLRPLAASSAGLMALCVLCVLALGRPWSVKSDPVLARVALEGSDWTVELPSLLAPVSTDDPKDHVFGDIRTDPVLVELLLLDAPGSSIAAEQAEREVREFLAKPGMGLRLRGEVTRQEVRGATVMKGNYLYTNGFEVRRWMVIRVDGVFRVDVLAWPEASETWKTVGDRVVASIEPREPDRDGR